MTHRRTYGLTDRPGYRDAETHLKNNRTNFSRIAPLARLLPGIQLKPPPPLYFGHISELHRRHFVVWAETAKTSMEVEEEPEVEDEDEDLGFDPFCESQRGLEDLLRGESTGTDAPEPYFGYG